MLDILQRAACFAAIIALGYGLKRIGIFHDEDFSVLSKVVIRITLPAAIITSFGGKEIDMSLLSLVFLALLCGFVYILAGFWLFRREGREDRAFAMLNLTGYNIGTFVIPFAQGFLGPMGVVTASIFDTGNAAICLGTAYSLASMVKDGTRFSVKRILKALSRSVPFICYVTMLTMNLIHLPVPGFIMSCAELIGDANAFMAMFMIGVGFNLSGDRRQMGRIIRILSVRYGIAALFAAVFYFLTPYAIEVRQALVVLALSPIAAVVPGFTGEMEGDVGLSSALNSMTILISIVITVAVLAVML